MATQDELFVHSEGNNWFKRNQEKLPNADFEILNYLYTSPLKPKKVLEIGCSNGLRLHDIAKHYGAACYGIEPSEQAVNDGKKKFPELHLTQGVSHDLSEYKDASFDMVVVSFVFHWIDRSLLLATVGEIDRVLKNSGYLIIQDFDPKYACKTKYHHLPKKKVYTYKQPYWDIFSTSNLYNIIFSKEFLHDPREEVQNNNICRLAVLQKRTESNYPLL